MGTERLGRGRTEGREGGQEGGGTRALAQKGSLDKETGSGEGMAWEVSAWADHRSLGPGGTGPRGSASQAPWKAFAPCLDLAFCKWVVRAQKGRTAEPLVSQNKPHQGPTLEGKGIWGQASAPLHLTKAST